MTRFLQCNSIERVDTISYIEIQFFRRNIRCHDEARAACRRNSPVESVTDSDDRGELAVTRLKKYDSYCVALQNPHGSVLIVPNTLSQ